MTTTELHSSTPLIRLEDQCWSLKLHQDDCKEGMGEARLYGHIFEVIHIAARIIRNLGLEKVISQETQFSVPSVRTLAGRWKINVQRPSDSYLNLFLQWLPFTRSVGKNTFIKIDVSKQTDDDVIARIEKAFSTGMKNLNLITVPAPDIIKMPVIDCPLNKTIADRIVRDPLTDSFTTIATLAFQNWEKTFVPQYEINSTHRIVLRNGQLMLEKNTGPPKVVEEEMVNQETVRTYQQLLLKKYGADKLAYIEYQFGFDLNELINTGMPLLPEHVYRINLGVNNVEIQDVELVYSRLHILREAATNASSSTTLQNFLAEHWEAKASTPEQRSTLRELRGLYRVVKEASSNPKPTVRDLQNLLGKIFENPVEKLEDLDPKSFNALVETLMVPNEHRDKIYTGRKITHMPIMGYYTTSEKTNFKPWVDLQELLQVFPDHEKVDDWENFDEMIANVAVKKHLIRQHPVDKWRVGGLIKGPNTKTGEARWFCVTTCTDNNHGDFNYTLEPACRYTDVPVFKLYRSTASDKYAMNGWQSVDADIQPFGGGPGAAYFGMADEYERPFFEKYTMPVWVGYYLKGRAQADELDAQIQAGAAIQRSLPESFTYWSQLAVKYVSLIHDYRTALHGMLKAIVIDIKGATNKETLNSAAALKADKKNEFRRRLESELSMLQRDVWLSHPTFDAPSAESVQRLQDEVELHRKFVKVLGDQIRSYAQEKKELPEYKKANNIAFVGHSLGGALAQRGLVYFGPQSERIPLPGQRFVCHAMDAPAISGPEVDAFMNFGDKHKDLLKFLKQKWKVTQTMEYGDPVPQSGSTHLGSTELPPEHYADWLSVQAQVFRPLETAVAKEVRDNVAHGRRIGLAKEGRDFQITRISPADLSKFDHAWWLNSVQNEIWGYRIVNSPKMSEGIRRTVGLLRLPIVALTNRIHKTIFPSLGDEMRDANDCFYAGYTPAKNLKACVLSV